MSYSTVQPSDSFAPVRLQFCHVQPYRKQQCTSGNVTVRQYFSFVSFHSWYVQTVVPVTPPRARRFEFTASSPSVASQDTVEAATPPRPSGSGSPLVSPAVAVLSQTEQKGPINRLKAFKAKRLLLGPRGLAYQALLRGRVAEAVNPPLLLKPIPAEFPVRVCDYIDLMIPAHLCVSGLSRCLHFLRERGRGPGATRSRCRFVFVYGVSAVFPTHYHLPAPALGRSLRHRGPSSSSQAS